MRRAFGCSGPAAPRLAAALTIAMFGFVVPPARAQIESREGIALQNQVLELRRDLQALREQVAHGATGGGGTFLGTPSSRPPAAASGAAGSDLLPQLLDRVQQFEDQVRTLQGRTDELANTMQRQNADLAKQIGDLNFRMDQQGAGAGPRPPAVPPAGAAPAGIVPPVATLPPTAPQPQAPAAGAVPRRPELALQEGNAALARRDYATALASADEVLAQGKAAPRAYDAQFLKAQALAGKKEWAQAAIGYDDTYNRSRTGTHAQDALLGLANSLIAINEKKSACQTLDKLHTEFPTPRQDLRDGIVQARERAGCH
jgi:TolA-binding protein